MSKDKAKTKTKPLSFRQTVRQIGRQLESWNESRLAIDLSDKIKKARDAVSNAEDADPTELLESFHPTEDELDQMGLPKDFLDKDRCTNHTAFYMADFTRFARFTHEGGG